VRKERKKERERERRRRKERVFSYFRHFDSPSTTTRTNEQKKLVLLNIFIHTKNY